MKKKTFNFVIKNVNGLNLMVTLKCSLVLYKATDNALILHKCLRPAVEASTEGLQHDNIVMIIIANIELNH